MTKVVLIYLVKMFKRTQNFILLVFWVFLFQSHKVGAEITLTSNPEKQPELILISNEKIEYSQQELRDSKIEKGLENLIPTNCGVQLHSVTYWTQNINNQPSQVSGLIVIPISQENKPFPVVSYQHGTMTGGNRTPSNINENYAWRIAATLGGSCFLTFATDYIGLGSSKEFQPYLHAKSEAQAAKDLLIQGLNYIQKNYQQIEISNKLFLWGHSQGGHSTLSLNRSLENPTENEDFIKETHLQLTATVAAASPIFLDRTTLEIINSPNSSSNTTVYGGLLFYSMNKIYQFVDDIHNYVNKPYADQFNQYFNGSKDFPEIAKKLPSRPNELFTQSFLESLNTNQNHPFLISLRDNNVLTNWIPKTPLMLFHGQADRDVPFSNSIQAYQQLKDLGVQHIYFKDLGKDSDHGDAYLKSMISGNKVVQYVSLNF